MSAIQIDGPGRVCFGLSVVGFCSAIAAVAIINRSIGMRSIGSKLFTLLLGGVSESWLNDVDGTVFRCVKLMSSPLVEPFES